MALARPRVADFVKETTDTEGTGAFALAGAVSGFRSFSVLTSGTPVYYAIVDNPDAITAFEQGIGTYTAGTPGNVSRDRVMASSNSGAKVSWSPGTKTIIITAAAELLNSILDSVDSDLVTAGTSTAYSLVTYRPAVGLFEGRFICAKFHVANGASPTLNVDGTGAKAIVDINGSAPASGSMPASYYFLKYNATAAKWVVFSPFNMGSASSKNLGADIVDDGTGNLTRSLRWVNHSASFSFVASDRGKRHRLYLAGGITATLLPVGTTDSGWNIEVEDPIGGSVIASPAADISVNGAGLVSSYAFSAGEWGTIASNGSAYVINTNKPATASTAVKGVVTLSTAAQARSKAGSTALTASNLSDVAFESSEIALTLGSSGTVAHGLGVKPKMVIAYIRCKTAEFGYSIGEELMFSTMLIAGVPSSGGLMASALDATNLRYVVNAANLYLLNASGGQNTLTVANWRLVLRAWA